jgi:hypothetical protein
MTKHYSRYREKKFLSSLKPSGEWSDQCLQRPTSPAIFLAKQILPNLKNRPVDVVYQKQHPCPFVHQLVTLKPSNWTHTVSQNQAFLRRLNNLHNMLQCHKQSSKLRIKNTSRTRYLIPKTTLFSPTNSKSCASIYQWAIEKAYLDVPVNSTRGATIEYIRCLKEWRWRCLIEPFSMWSSITWVAKSASNSCRVKDSDETIYSVAKYRNNPQYNDPYTALSSIKFLSLLFKR